MKLKVFLQNKKRQFSVMLLLTTSFAFSQTIPASTAAANCTSCAPTGWSIVTGTPDISSQTVAASSGGVSGGAGALWTNATGGGGTAVTLPAAPNGSTRWITLRDVGPGNPEESISAPIGSLIVGREYEVVVYSLTATTNQAGTANVAYAGTYNDFFTFQVGAGPLQNVSLSPAITPVRTWGTRRLRFIASATSETIVLRPGTNSAGTSANGAADYLLFQAVNLAVTVNAVNAVPIAGNDTGTTLQNVPVTVNVTTNDSDPDGAIVVSTVDLDTATAGIQNTLTTAQGTWTVNNLGVVTFTPISSFVGTATIPYTIQDNYTVDGNSVPATSAPANISITVIGDNDGDGIRDSIDYDKDNDGILDTDECGTVNINSTNFNSVDGTQVSFTAPASDVGYILDIFTLDNSFNLVVNGNNLLTGNNNELQFQSGVTGSAQNVRFADGTIYGAGGQAEIYALTGNATNPIIRVTINRDGTVNLLGSKTSGGALLPLQIYNGSTLNNITWNTTGNNTVVLNQLLTPPTSISGNGRGLQLAACDSDNDGIRNYFDVDSDNDGCADAVEGSESVRITQIHSLSLPTSDANYLYRGQIKVLANGSMLGTPAQVISTVAAANGVPQLVNNATGNPGATGAGIADNTDGTADIGQGLGTSQISTTRDVECDRCFRPATSPGIGGSPTNHGITALSRAGTANGNWPMKITGAYTALDAKTKGFVVNRMPTSQLSSITAPVRGMMVYDTTVNCLKIYDDSNSWRCFSSPTCDNFNN